MYTLKKFLGQHFLHDENMCRKIVQALPVSPGMRLLEVGPGAGALTKYLLQLPETDFKAIEVDKEKVDYLLKQYPSLKGKLIHQDFLESPVPFEGRFSVIGNFPYNISSQILFHLLEWKEQVELIVGMFQKEMARRIISPPGSKEYGILSVLTQAFFKVEYLFDVHESCFQPPPKVKSGVIRLVYQGSPYQLENEKRFFTLVKASFGQRRKQLRNPLRHLFDRKVLEENIFTKRAEQLSVSEFVELSKRML